MGCLLRIDYRTRSGRRVHTGNELGLVYRRA